MADIRTRQIAANGLAFAVDEAGEGDDVALLLHGFPESRRSWRGQLPLLAELGWRAVAPDLRGYGGTSRPKARNAYALDHLVTDVGALFDALGARRRLLIGHDWGGMIAWAAAGWRVRPLDGLVVMNAPHPAAYALHVAHSPAQLARSWYALFFQLPWLPEALLTAGKARAVGQAFSNRRTGRSVFSPEDIEQHRAQALLPGAMTAMLGYYRANAQTIARAPRTLANPIATPTLLIWGEQDPYAGPELPELCRSYAQDLTIRRLPEIGHWVQQEAPEAVDTALREWLVTLAPSAK